MRAALSPAFTGNKMRLMFDLVSECADDIVKHFLKRSANGEKINVEGKDFCSRYTNDVIATCAFGIKVNSFIDEKNEFYIYGQSLLNAGWMTSVKFVFALLLPKVAKALNIKVIDANTFKKIILETMETRRKNDIVRPDMINILMQLQDETSRSDEQSKEIVDDAEKPSAAHKWTENELVAQSFIFFSAGLEPPRVILTFAFAELVLNPDIQQKLYEEIAEMDKQLGGKPISYDSIQKLKYLDQVISETLRKWPSVNFTDRCCVKDYVYDDGNLKFTIEKGSQLLFSVLQIHRDAKYFPDPDKFDPERFNDENKHNIVPGTYNPFGAGPRSCIGKKEFEIDILLTNIFF